MEQEETRDRGSGEIVSISPPVSGYRARTEWNTSPRFSEGNSNQRNVEKGSRKDGTLRGRKA
jgi:hypothetical protein